MAEKRRGTNFSQQEVKILIKLCNKNKNVIECKKTDALTNKEKEDAWQRILKQYTLLSMDSTRTVKQLIEKYKAVKKKLKNDYSKNLGYIKGTGGGPYIPPPSPKTEEEKELLQTIKLSVEGLTNPFDNDGLSGTQGIAPHEISNEANKQSDDVTTDADWTSGSALLWQTPKRPALNTNNIYSLGNDAETSSFEKVLPITAQPAVEVERTDQIQDHENIKGYEENVIEIMECPDENQEVNNNEKKKWQSRRRPVIKKKKTVSSAGAKFELVAEKKLELIGLQKMVIETQQQQNTKEHETKMEILNFKSAKKLLNISCYKREP